MVSNLHWTCWCYLTVALFKNKPLAIFSDRGGEVNLSHAKQRIHFFFFFFFTNQLIHLYIRIWDIFSHYLILDPQVSSQYSTMQVLSHPSFVCFAVQTYMKIHHIIIYYCHFALQKYYFMLVKMWYLWHLKKTKQGNLAWKPTGTIGQDNFQRIITRNQAIKKWELRGTLLLHISVDFTELSCSKLNFF